MVDSLVGRVIQKFVDYLWDGLKTQVNYLCCYSSNVQRLADEIEELKNKKASLDLVVNAARNNVDVILPEVESWLSEAEKVLENSNKIVEDATRVQKSRLFSEWCPVLHYTMSKEANNTVEKSIQLKSTSDFPRISIPRNPADIDPPPLTSQVGFESRDSIETQILTALKDESVYMIGLCGMGGVGKTTMAKSIAARARNDSGSIIKHVVVAVVSQNQDIHKIQQEIAEGLGFNNVKQESTHVRAKLLHEKLKNERSGLLIILDDVWERLNLEEIGIPSQGINPMCKLILTSRNKHALEGAKIFELDFLTDEESWILFKKNAGDEVINSPDDLEQIAKDVMKECKGLPLALVTVGRALKGKRRSSWQDALLELRKSMPRNIPDVLRCVYAPLRLSFNHLESHESRYLFLLCCLFPEDSDISIEALVTYGMGLEIFKEIEKLEQARNRVATIVGNLISSSLLIETRDRRDHLQVKMHDVIRDMGIFIASEKNIENECKIASQKPVFKISHGEKEWPVIVSDNYTCISLIVAGYKMIDSDCINSPNLELLDIDCETSLAEDFFSGIRRLKVLRASGIKLLPSSNIQVLKNLRALHLYYCQLDNRFMAGLGELTNLEILQFEYCDGLEVFPKEMGGFKKLRKLEIESCQNLKTIAFGVVSRLVRLEELVIIDSFADWEAQENVDNKMINNNASLVELDSLIHLTTLRIELSSANAIPKRKPDWVQRLEKYSISVSGAGEIPRSREFQKCMAFDELEDTPFGDWIYEMARHVDYLCLRGSNCMSFVKILDQSGYKKLKHFELCDFSSLQYLSSSLGEEDQCMGAVPVFPKLKFLTIEDSSSLQKITQGSLPTGSFEALEVIRLWRLSKLFHLSGCPSQKLCLSTLKVVNIDDCESLLYLFPLSTLECLQQLTDLSVSNCPNMKEIFKTEEGLEITERERKKKGFPKLKSLELHSLASLYQFCERVDEINVPTLFQLTITSLPRITEKSDNNTYQEYLFNQVVEDNMSLKPRMMFSTFAKFNFGTGLGDLYIGSIHNLKSFFSHSVISSFPSLSSLRIEDCSRLEIVIGRNDENVEQTKTKSTIFPQLEYLTLSDLPNINAFCHILRGEVLELPSLRSLVIMDCPVMETFVRGIPGTTNFFFSEKVFFPGLFRLELKGLNIKGIFGQNSRILKILEILLVQDCKNLLVIAKEDEEEQTTTLHSLQLKRIRLTRLPKAHTFFSTRNHLEMPLLEWVTIHECPMLQRFSLGPRHLPCLKGIQGLSDHDLAAKIFFKKEKSYCETGLENNCFTISSRNLSINTEPEEHLRWFLARASSDSFFAAVSIVDAEYKVKITGKVETIKLLIGIEYEIIFIIMFDDIPIGWDAVDLELTLSGDIIKYGRESLNEKPKNEWIEILVGEFKRDADHQIGDLLEFSLSQPDADKYKTSLSIGAASIRKKLIIEK